MCVLQNGLAGVRSVPGDNLCKYSISNGHLLVLNGASILRVYLVSFLQCIFLEKCSLILHCLFLSVGAFRLFCVNMFHGIFHSFGSGSIRRSISVCCVVYVMKYSTFHVSRLS